MLLAHLQPLVARKVPVRGVEPVPELRTVRVRFADGTAVVVRGEVAGDAGVLASVLRDHTVLPSACSTDAAGTRLVFDWSRRPPSRRHAGHWSRPTRVIDAPADLEWGAFPEDAPWVLDRRQIDWWSDGRHAPPRSPASRSPT